PYVLSPSLFERHRPADDLGQFGRDLRLPGAVVLLAERADDLVGVIGGGLHRHAAGDLLAHRRVEETLEQPHLERHGQDLFENPRRVRQELVLRLRTRLRRRLRAPWTPRPRAGRRSCTRRKGPDWSRGPGGWRFFPPRAAPGAGAGPRPPRRSGRPPVRRSSA